MGRKSKYTPETVKKLTDAIKLGATYELACGYAGITYETLRVWLATKPAFSEALKEAEGAAAVGWLARIEKAAQDGTWQAAAWKLERRYPADYGRTVQEHRHTFAVQQEAERIAAALGLSVDEVLAEAQDILKAAH
jgi:transposase